jgi:8-oxo-dGTP pyrophosphatase MutT (NUDIX family)
MKDPNNKSTATNPVGRFMVAVGAIIELKNTGKILILKRNKNLDWHAGEWEIHYGRIAQFENLESSLKREAHEETGLTDLQIIKPLTAWHIFRGREKAENELIGITFHCRTKTEKVKISDEHAGYRWVKPEEALKLIKIEGIRHDVETYSATMRRRA